VLLAPVAVESFSVLTRMPPPHRAPAHLAMAFLEEHFDWPVHTLAAGAYEELLRDAGRSGILGGAVYDALVALTAREADSTLVSLDRRAARTYLATGVEHRLIA
jgi:predicted nucleic acid-binding protein